MNSEWKEYSFQDITINYDKKRKPLSSKQRETMKGIYPYYGAQGIIDSLNDFIFDGTYMLIAEDGENLKSKKQNIAQLAHGQFWVNNHAHIVTNNNLSDIRYLCYLFNVTDVSGYITGSAQPKLSQANLNSIKFTIPLLQEQKAIADTLSSLDDKIELNNRINKTLEEMVQAIFKSWFVDFEPFQDGEFEDSELGRIPKGWRVGTLGDYVRILTKSINPQNEAGVNFEHYSIPAYDEGKMPVFQPGDDIKSNKYIVSSNCFLVSKLNPSTKRIWRPYCITKNAICSTEFMVYESIDSEYTDFYYSLINHSAFYNFIVSNVTGSTNSRQRAIPSTTLNFKFICPTEVEIIKFINVVNPIYRKLQENIIENQRFLKIRESLLPKLMSGEIRVPIEEV